LHFSLSANGFTVGAPSVPVFISTRSLAKVARASRQPSLTGPRTQSSGTNTSSRNTSFSIGSPVMARSGRTTTPGVVMSSRKYVIPRCLATSRSVRAKQIAQSASAAWVGHTFWPFRRQPPCAQTAVVLSDTKSDPAPGSLNS
jgi:hypothetical protein